MLIFAYITTWTIFAKSNKSLPFSLLFDCIIGIDLILGYSLSFPVLFLFRSPSELFDFVEAWYINLEMVLDSLASSFCTFSDLSCHYWPNMLSYPMSLLSHIIHIYNIYSHIHIHMVTYIIAFQRMSQIDLYQKDISYRWILLFKVATICHRVKEFLLQPEKTETPEK